MLVDSGRYSLVNLSMGSAALLKLSLKRDYIGQTVVAVTGRETDEKAVGFLQFSQFGLNLAKFELGLVFSSKF